VGEFSMIIFPPEIGFLNTTWFPHACLIYVIKRLSLLLPCVTDLQPDIYRLLTIGQKMIHPARLSQMPNAFRANRVFKARPWLVGRTVEIGSE